MTDTTKKAPIPVRLNASANTGGEVGRIKPIDQSVEFYKIPTQALLQVLEGLNQINYGQASPIITAIMMTAEPLEGSQE